MTGRSPHAVTDVTGFGLVGHGWEIAERSRGGASVSVADAAARCIPGPRPRPRPGSRTGGDARNRTHLTDRFSQHRLGRPEALALDPQTSGGLLAAVSPAVAGELISSGWWEVGEVTAGPAQVELV